MDALKLLAALLMLAPALAGYGSATAQAQRGRTTATVSRTAASTVDARLTGIYRLDLAASDKLYSVISGASSNLPFGEQQRFFIDLTVRLTPPDQLAIERRGRQITIASSRSPRLSFEADGIWRRERAADDHVVRTRAVFDGERLLVSTFGSTHDQFTVTFEPTNGGRRLRVARRIFAEQLERPILIESVYDRISDVARWDIYGQPGSSVTPTSETAATAATAAPAENAATTTAATAEGAEAARLRATLDDWIDATNERDIVKQMRYYAPRLKAFYLTRDVPMAAVRAEKRRVFSRADAIDVRAADPEIIFTDAGRVAVMRFRKRYSIEGGGQARRGEVVQELRWQKTGGDWKIFSERDVRVIR